jgi:hypothetical protein
MLLLLLHVRLVQGKVRGINRICFPSFLACNFHPEISRKALNVSGFEASWEGFFSGREKWSLVFWLKLWKKRSHWKPHWKEQV